MKNKGMNEAQFLSLLQKVLPKATDDTHLATMIYEEVAREVRLLNSLKSFEKFCETGALPNAEPDTVAGLQSELAEKFGEANVTVTPNENGAGVAVEIALPDRTVTTRVRVDPTAAAAEEEVKIPFVPFPVALPEDPELVWLLGRREDLGPDEAARALATIEEELAELEQVVAASDASDVGNGEIADQLSLSIETIRMNVKHIYAKLHVHSRGEAVAKYLLK